MRHDAFLSGTAGIRLRLRRMEPWVSAISEETGELLLERTVRTDPGELREVVGAIAGRKKVLFEEGPLSGLIRDALEGLVEEVISCDPTKNALIARSEHSTDELDARRLGQLGRMGVIHPVYILAEPLLGRHADGIGGIEQVASLGHRYLSVRTMPTTTFALRPARCPAGCRSARASPLFCYIRGELTEWLPCALAPS